MQTDLFVDTSLKRAHDQVFAQLAEGSVCPCCEQLAQERKRKLRASMSVFLIRLYHLHSITHDYVHRLDVGHTSNDYAFLRFWDLIRLKPNLDDPSKNHVGLWKPTDRGAAFVLGLEVVPAYCVVYNNTVRAWSTTLVDIRQTLGKRFDYAELIDPAARNKTRELKA